MTRYAAFCFLTRCLALEDGQTEQQKALDREIRSGSVEWEKVIAIASRHYMISALAVALRDRRLVAALPEDVAEFFAEISELGAERNRRIGEQVLEIARALNGIGLEPVIIKGAGHLMNGLYPDRAARLMADIDILIPADRLPEAFVRLRAEGYGVRVQQPDSHHHGDELSHPGRLAAVELHRRIGQGVGESLLNGAEVRARARRWIVDGAACRIPCSTDSAIIAIAHAYLHHHFPKWGATLYRDFYDLLLLDRRSGDRPDWSEVRRRFAAEGQQSILERCFTLTERMFGQPRPATVGTHRASGWEWWRYSLASSHPWVFLVPEFLSAEIDRLNSAVHMAGSASEEATALRRKLLTPAFYKKHLESAVANLRRDARQ